MPWKSLKNPELLSKKPQILAGPVLRKVTSKSVTVWLAFRSAGKVTLTVQNDQQKPFLKGTRDTLSIGTNLHFVAVTADKPILPFTGELEEGTVYRYDIALELEGGVPIIGLGFLAPNTDLGYSVGSLPGRLPSFALPPKDPNLLRLLQGSCRRPHAVGSDALALVDDLIAETASNAFARPHQLLLTGDQIYADDVADALLFMLMDASDALLGWQEQLPFPASFGGPSDHLPPAPLRYYLLKPILTSVDLRSHLMSLGEYLCMYLFVWSDVLWPAEQDLPSFNDLSAAFTPSIDRWFPKGKFKLKQKEVETHTSRLAEFRRTLQKVRRALANIPSYMIFDDHEVTDDWNMTLEYCRRLYSNLNSELGLRMVQNALVAYALCQHWGNVPEAFESGPGLDLFKSLGMIPAPKVRPLQYNDRSEKIRSLLGMQSYANIAQKKAVFHDPLSLQYHYTVEGPAHQIIFTDTRTWRAFPNKDPLDASELLPKDQFIEQIGKTVDDRVLLVVLSTNAPPVGPIRLVARHPGLPRRFTREPDVFDSWEIPSVPFDRLLTALTGKLPIGAKGRRGSAILLSGDVHMSFASRLVYRANVRFEDGPIPPRTDAVIAQLVASPFKNEVESTDGFDKEGYYHAPGRVKRIAAKALKYLPRHTPEGYVGWNVKPDPSQEIGSEGVAFVTPSGVGPEPGFRIEKIILKDCATIALQMEDNLLERMLELSRLPDYRYRLDYLLASVLRVRDRIRPKIQPISGGKSAAIAYNVAHAHYRNYNAGSVASKQAIVRVNNFSEITFKWGKGDDRQVHHTLRVYDSKTKSYETLTTCHVSLDPDDKDNSGKLTFPDLKASKGDWPP